MRLASLAVLVSVLLAPLPLEAQQTTSTVSRVGVLWPGGSDLPVEQPTKLERILNMKTARALNLAVPPAVLGQADRVID